MQNLNENEKNRRSFFVKAYKIVAVLAPFGFILSIAFFMVQTKRSEKLVNNLVTIEQSLSTKYIGIFPDYLDKINQLLSETPLNDTAKIVIFEDVLFYGAFYNRTEFKKMIENLTKLSTHGKRITISYYDNSDNMRAARMFREVVQESWMRQTDLSKLAQDRRVLMDSLQNQNVLRRRTYNIADSIASEKYFACYRDGDRKEFEQRVRKILIPLYDATKNDYQVFSKIDEIKNNYLNKPANAITFYDMYMMYQQITDELETFFKTNKIQLIPLDNYLTMSCWSNGEEVLFAFPGRFAADEIGFMSQDLAILRYIDTMLEGVKSSLKSNSNENDN
jgi:hypothetical protein